jgi:hypothetical protein
MPDSKVLPGLSSISLKTLRCANILCLLLEKFKQKKASKGKKTKKRKEKSDLGKKVTFEG